MGQFAQQWCVLNWNKTLGTLDKITMIMGIYVTFFWPKIWKPDFIFIQVAYTAAGTLNGVAWPRRPLGALDEWNQVIEKQVEETCPLYTWRSWDKPNKSNGFTWFSIFFCMLIGTWIGVGHRFNSPSIFAYYWFTSLCPLEGMISYPPWKHISPHPMPGDIGHSAKRFAANIGEGAMDPETGSGSGTGTNLSQAY